MIPQVQREATVSASDETVKWKLSTRIGFRFVFCYVILYLYPRAVGSLGREVTYSNPVRDLWHSLVPWFGTNVLHIKGDFTEVANGSGDQLYDYVLLICIFLIAAVATAIWSWLDRKRPNYEVLYQWLRVLIRMAVGVAMISYGTHKLWRSQFPDPPLERFVEPYGQSTPMDLLWTFMGMSRMYAFFGGMGEMLGAALLFVPRFTVMGALVTIGVMTNVLMLNLGYDVPRKIYSIHLILLCVFLLLPDIRRLIDFFVLNRKVQLTPPAPLSRDRFLNYGIWALQGAILVVSLIVCSNVARGFEERTSARLPAPLPGIWSVDELVTDGVVRPPMVTDRDRWRRIILNMPKVMVFQPMDGPVRYFQLSADPERNSLTVWNPNNPNHKETLTYVSSGPDHMDLQGVLDGHQIFAKLSRVDLSDPKNFRLTHNPHAWIDQTMNLR